MYTTRLKESIEVDRNASDVYRYLNDFSTIEQWDPGVYRAHKITPGPVQIGSEFHLVLNTMGRHTPMTYRMVEMIPDRSICLVGRADGLKAEDRIEIQPLGQNRCRIDYEAQLTFDPLPSMAGFLIKPALVKVGKKAVQGLKTALTQGPVTPQKSGPAKLSERLLLPAAVQFTERGYLSMPVKAHSRYLDGQTIVITGPTSGIGLAAACELARLGARLVLVGRGQDRLERAAEVIRDFSGEPSALRLIEADLAHADEIDHATQSILEIEPRIDILINNAGALFGERQVTSEGYERSFSINLLAPMRMTFRLLPALKESRGRVINVSSGGQYMQPLKVDDLQYEHEDYEGSKAYARAKRGLVALTRAMANQYRTVGFHSMHPGWVATPGVSKSLPAFDRVMKPFLRDSRMGADTIVWLCSENAKVLGSGNFWFDRKAQPYDVLPKTSVTDLQLEQLIRQIQPIYAA